MQERKYSLPDLSVVLVNYKSFEMTSICLDLIQKAFDVAEVPVWVVDNDSNDESLAYLRTLDWIHLIERQPQGKETGPMAHGRALDEALGKVVSKYVLLLHTDTFIYDASIIHSMLEKCMGDDKLAAIGCKEPVFRSIPHRIIRIATRCPKYYFRKLKVLLGVPTRSPKLYYEIYLKSFCALWNVEIIKQHGMNFSMGDCVPGYEMQDRLSDLGYQFIGVPPKKMFECLDHIEKATASANDGVRINFRKAERYRALFEKVRNQAPVKKAEG